MFHWNRKNTEPHLTEKNNQGVTWLSFPAIEATGIAKHAFSTRMGGVSEGPFATMNFSFTRGDDPEAVKERVLKVFDKYLDYEKVIVSCHAMMIMYTLGDEKTTEYGQIRRIRYDGKILSEVENVEKKESKFR